MLTVMCRKITKSFRMAKTWHCSSLKFKTQGYFTIVLKGWGWRKDCQWYIIDGSKEIHLSGKYLQASLDSFSFTLEALANPQQKRQKCFLKAIQNIHAAYTHAINSIHINIDSHASKFCFHFFQLLSTILF